MLLLVTCGYFQEHAIAKVKEIKASVFLIKQKIKDPKNRVFEKPIDIIKWVLKIKKSKVAKPYKGHPSLKSFHFFSEVYELRTKV